jgi:hypothetical protein
VGATLVRSRRWTGALLLAVLGTLLTLATPVDEALAATITVNSTTDSPKMTRRSRCG